MNPFHSNPDPGFREYEYGDICRVEGYDGYFRGFAIIWLILFAYDSEATSKGH